LQTATAQPGMSFVTTAPAPMITPDPMDTLARIMAYKPYEPEQLRLLFASLGRHFCDELTSNKYCNSLTGFTIFLK
jgi:hypothetical protein